MNWYSYGANNPVSSIDPSGEFLDWLADIVFVGMDAWELIKHPSWGNAGWLVTDIGLGVAPIVPAGAGAAKRGISAASQAGKAVDAGKAVKTAQCVAKVADKADELLDLLRKVPGWNNKAVKIGPKRWRLQNGKVLSYHKADGGLHKACHFDLVPRKTPGWGQRGFADGKGGVRWERHRFN